MSTVSKKSKQQIFVKTLVLGLITLTLYAGLLYRQREIMDLIAKGRWIFFVPVSIAFLFSYIHGAFTANFWDLLGIKARQTKGE